MKKLIALILATALVGAYGPAFSAFADHHEKGEDKAEEGYGDKDKSEEKSYDKEDEDAKDMEEEDDDG